MLLVGEGLDRLVEGLLGRRRVVEVKDLLEGSVVLELLVVLGPFSGGPVGTLHSVG